MNKFIFLLMCCCVCLNSPLNANEDLLKLFHLAVENNDLKLLGEVIEALLKMDNNSENLLNALSQYSEKGKVDFALHNAIKDKNLLASVILTHYAKDVNTRKSVETVWLQTNSAIQQPAKTPIELALEADMIGLIPYLLMKNANPYLMKPVNFLYESEENPDYLIELGYKAEKKVCVKSKIAFFRLTPINYPTTQVNMNRTFIGDVIAKNRLDVIEILQKASRMDWNKTCCTTIDNVFTPLQFALAIKHYEIAQFLIDHGARIE